MKNLDEKSIIKELEIDARAVGIPPGAAEIFINKSIASAKKSLKSRKIITEKDLKLSISKELKKYNADLAYVYENRDKII